MDFVSFLLNSVLGFLAGTIKNPKSVAKYGKILCIIRDGFTTLCNALQPPAVGKAGASGPTVTVDQLLDAQRELHSIK